MRIAEAIVTKWNLYANNVEVGSAPKDGTVKEDPGACKTWQKFAQFCSSLHVAAESGLVDQAKPSLDAK